MESVNIPLFYFASPPATSLLPNLHPDNTYFVSSLTSYGATTALVSGLATSSCPQNRPQFLPRLTHAFILRITSVCSFLTYVSSRSKHPPGYNCAPETSIDGRPPSSFVYCFGMIEEKEVQKKASCVDDNESSDAKQDSNSIEDVEFPQSDNAEHTSEPDRRPPPLNQSVYFKTHRLHRTVPVSRCDWNRLPPLRTSSPPPSRYTR